MITRMPPYNVFEELPKIANQVREISEDLGAELDFAVEAMRTTFALAVQKASTARTDGWVSVEERLPAEGQMVLVAYDCAIPEKQISIGFPNGGKWGEAFGLVRVTHWQPLPAAPGSVPQAQDSPTKPYCDHCGVRHFRGENTLCNDGAPQAEPTKEEK